MKTRKFTKAPRRGHIHIRGIVGLQMFVQGGKIKKSKGPSVVWSEKLSISAPLKVWIQLSKGRGRSIMERINVTVRARPLSTEDAKTSPWRISSNSITFSCNSSKFDFGMFILLSSLLCFSDCSFKISGSSLFKLFVVLGSDKTNIRVVWLVYSGRRRSKYRLSWF